MYIIVALTFVYTTSLPNNSWTRVGERGSLLLFFVVGRTTDLACSSLVNVTSNKLLPYALALAEGICNTKIYAINLH